MSTRATYQFHRNQLTCSATVYIHHDGYPEGAAIYLANAIGYEGDYEETEILTVERFIRANEGAHITKSHEAHGDTDYRYDFFPFGLMEVSKREIYKNSFGEYQEQWKKHWSGHLSDFLHINIEPKSLAGCYEGIDA